MRFLSIAATIVALAVFGDAAHAEWCAAYRNGGNNCGFQTFQQCMATLSGIGGFCNVSPYSSSRQSARPQSSSTAARETKRHARREAKHEPVHQAKAKPVRQIAKRHLPSEEPADNRGISPGDDDHIIPAEPE